MLGKKERRKEGKKERRKEGKKERRKVCFETQKNHQPKLMV